MQQIRLAGDLLTFEGYGSDGSIASYVADLATKQVVSPGASREQLVGAPRASGRHVLWYDATGGHVGELPD